MMAQSERFPDGQPDHQRRIALLEGHTDRVNSVEVYDSGRLAVSCSLDHTLRVWNLETHTAIATLEGHSDIVINVAVYDDSRRAISCSRDRTLRVWDLETHTTIATLEGHSETVTNVAVYDDNRRAISCSLDHTLRVWDLETHTAIATLGGHVASVMNVAVYDDNRRAISCSFDNTLRVWDLETHTAIATLEGHVASVMNVAVYDDNRRAISCSADGTLRVWDLETHTAIATLEGHVASVMNVAVYDDNRRAISCSFDGTLRVWSLVDYALLITLPMAGPISSANSLAEHFSLLHHEQMIALSGANALEIWNLAELVESLGALYTNAKVVLVGDSGVGKSGLRLVLEGKSFVPTDSSHGRFVTDFDSRQIELSSGHTVHCETLLWDLAGQPGYRLIHQFHLKEVAVALVVFDAKSETAPFAGVRHWDRALRQAQRVQGASPIPLKKFLVASRMDRGGLPVSRERIESVVSELEFDGYFETSAKEGTGVSELADTIRAAIDWEAMPKVSSTDLFQDIKQFLLDEKETGQVLAPVDGLYRLYRSRREATEADFATCINRLQDRDLIRRLGFGNLLLLQPERIDNYASALVNAARQEPQGLGSMAEENALAGRFDVPSSERLEDVEQEELLLIAMVNDMLQHEIVLRETAEGGVYLIFPSQFTRENPALPDPPGKAMVYEFEGPVLNIYTTLAVRLSYSYAFKHRELWRNAITYTYQPQEGVCGMFLTEIREGQGRLTLFYSEDAPPGARTQFEGFIRAHLTSHAIPESITQCRMIACDACGTPVSEIVMQRLLERGREGLTCPVCDAYIPLALESPPDASSRAVVLDMGRSADAARRREEATAIIKGKRSTQDFDVFLCHNTADKDNVRAIGQRLQQSGILPWLDEWELRPGLPWQRALEAQIGNIKSVAVFIGQSGFGPWQHVELEAFLREFVRRQCPVIPVLLADAPSTPELPIFLNGFMWVDFRVDTPDPFDQLVWGITDQRPETAWEAPGLAMTRGATPPGSGRMTRPAS